ncbi:MAG: hypothetical protein QMB94_01830 [Phycisphaerales bacterium]
MFRLLRRDPTPDDHGRVAGVFDSPKMPALPRGTTGFFSRACARVDRDARRATAVDNHHGVTGRWHLAGSGRSLVDWYDVASSIQESP